MSYTLLEGSNLDLLPTLPDCSVDAIVTDPPYELGFMGKSWDASGIAYSVDLWRECLRVLKHGGHLLAFGGSRTYHRLACAVEDAGFEIRDQIMWVYGSGFPKSLDISKAIDKKRDDRKDIEKVVRWLEQKRIESGVTRKQVEAHFQTVNIGQSLFTITAGSSPRVATWEQWQQLKALIGFGNEMDSEVWRLNGRKGQPSENWFEREVIGTDTKARSTTGKSALPTTGGETIYQTWDVTAPATDEAKQWSGWGTALKPAHEPIVVARKPLDGTVANNVLKHGVGGFNIDGCRVGTEDQIPSMTNKNFAVDGYVSGTTHGERNTTYTPSALGRFPANFIHDGSEEVLALFPDTKSTRSLRGDEQGGLYSGGWSGNTVRGHDDSGSAARFFYCAKASKAERNAGLDIDQFPLRHYTNANKMGGENDTMLTGSGNPRDSRKQNFHPTVKPIALMRYLIRLVTPPNGTVLDPFAGSGTTLVAAIQEGMQPIGIELTADYWQIIHARCEHATSEPIQQTLT